MRYGEQSEPAAHKANAGGFDTAKLEYRVQVARIEELLNHILL